jgi:hypothetical protein
MDPIKRNVSPCPHQRRFLSDLWKRIKPYWRNEERLINGSRMFLMFCFHSRHAIAGRASEDKLELTSSAG